MKRIDVSEEIFEMVDRVLGSTVPEYQNQLEEFGIALPYIYIDRIVQEDMKISMIDRSVYIMDLDNLIDKALADGQVTEYERENYLLMSRFNIKL